MKHRQAAALLAGGAAGAVLLYRRWARRQHGAVVDDVHARLNPTRVERIVRPASLDEARTLLRNARLRGASVAIAGGRHAMGGQQFAAGATLVDTRGLDRVLSFDREGGIVEVEAGIEWPELVRYLDDRPLGPGRWWSIAQKQTGADRLTIGGALSANVHGRALRMKPIVADVESFTLLDAEGDLRVCSRQENPELFRLAIGGYGLFGLITTVRLRLVPRAKVQRVVAVIDIGDLVACVEQRVAEGFAYGDFQFAIDEGSDDFLRRGVFSCYRPVPMETPMPSRQRSVSRRAWNELVYLAHTDKSRAFRLYADYYLSTSGQVYWSDTHQLAAYLDDYHSALDRRTGAWPGSEVITELFVPRPALAAFMAQAREDFRRHGVNVIYGTVRFVERDDESFLAWAREAYAGVIFNLHTEHTPQGLEHSAEAFRRLIDMAIRHHGTYYLTYHRYATAEQVTACYPRFAEFLALKRRYDPPGLFQSDWYRHHARLLGSGADARPAWSENRAA